MVRTRRRRHRAWMSEVSMSPSPRGDSWTLTAPVPYLIDGGDMRQIPTGYTWDGASVPRLLWRVIPPHYYPRASLLHDWLYTTHEVPRVVADAVYHDSLRQSGASRPYAWASWAGVRLFGGRAWRS